MADTTTDADRDMLTPARLREIGLFGGITGPTLDRLCEAMPVRRIEPGQYVVQEGDAAQAMYIVLEGELEVVKGADRGSDVRVAVLGRGDWFGEMSLLDVQPRSASVMCVAPSVIASITNRQVDELLYRSDLKAYTLLVMNIARELSRRLRVADGILAHVQMILASEYSRGSGAR